MNDQRDYRNFPFGNIEGMSRAPCFQLDMDFEKTGENLREYILCPVRECEFLYHRLREHTDDVLQHWNTTARGKALQGSVDENRVQCFVDRELSYDELHTFQWLRNKYEQPEAPRNWVDKKLVFKLPGKAKKHTLRRRWEFFFDSEREVPQYVIETLNPRFQLVKARKADGQVPLSLTKFLLSWELIKGFPDDEIEPLPIYAANWREAREKIRLALKHRYNALSIVTNGRCWKEGEETEEGTFVFQGLGHNLIKGRVPKEPTLNLDLSSLK